MTTPKKAAAKRRSSKRRPMGLSAVARFIDADVASSLEEASRPTLRITVPFKARKGQLDGQRFTVMAQDGGPYVHLRLPVVTAVPKERINEALKLLRRLHELR